MHDRVEDADHFPVEIQDARNPDALAIRAGESLGDRGLAVPRGPVEEHRASGADGLPDLMDGRFIDDQVGQRLADLIGAWSLGEDRLGGDGLLVVCQGDGCSAVIGRDGVEAVGPLDTGSRQLVLVVAQAAGGPVTDQAFRFETTQDFGDDVVGQRDLLGEFASRDDSPVEQILDEQRFDLDFVEAGFGQTFRSERVEGGFTGRKFARHRNAVDCWLDHGDLLQGFHV